MQFRGFPLLSIFILVGVFGQCQKKDCSAPCKLLQRCARTRLNLADKDLNALRSACDHSCPKYYNAVMDCYRQAQEKEDGCIGYYRCAVRKYRAGAY